MRGTIRRRRWMAMARSMFLCLLSALSVACADSTTMAPHPPAPLLLDWDWSVSAGATNPQAAYARSAHFAPCLLPRDRTTTATDQSVTWLLSGPDVGVVYLRASCSNTPRGNYLYRNSLVLIKGTQNAWYADGFERRLPFPAPVDSTPTQELGVPSLIDLFPADTYVEQPVWRATEPISIAGRSWVSLTSRDYVLGLVQGTVTRPPEAVATTLDGLQGWVTETNGMATVVAPRPDGVIFVSAGTGCASEIEAIAARALPRAEEALGGPLLPEITPTP